MSIDSKKSALGAFVSIFLALFIAKAIWVFAEVKYLPKKGIDIAKDIGVKSLYYHYNLASKKDKPKPIIKHYKPAKVVSTRKPKVKPKPKKVTKFILKGIYDSTSKKVIIVEYLNKSYALSLGETLEGYKFTKLADTTAIFTKNGIDYKVNLFTKDKKSSKKSNNSKPQRELANNIDKPKPKTIKKEPKREEPVTEGGTTYIPKSTFNKYKGNYAQIRRNINAIPNMENGKLNGFKISFVKANSDFAKLGLKRGDIITAINGEPLNNFKVPLEFFNNIDTISAATLTIKRGNEIKELEYEVR